MTNASVKHINGIDIAYELQGNGEPIVLIAGFSCDRTFWSLLVNELALKFQVLTFDNRGIGQTDAPDSAYSVSMMADDTMALIRALNLKMPTIIGQSMGSAITQTLAKNYPNEIKKIVLLNTFYKLEKAPVIAFELTGELQRLNVPINYRVQSIAPWVFSSAFLSQDNQLSMLIKLAEDNPYPQTLVGYKGQLVACKEFNSLSWLIEIKVPTLIIAGVEDIIAPPAGAKEIAHQISQAQLQLIPGGHASPIEQPRKVLEAILGFI